MSLRICLGLFGVVLVSSMLAACTALKNPNDRLLEVDARDAALDVNDIDAFVCPDFDGDGYTDIACGGTDCDDTESGIQLGATETCDGLDNDCDGAIDEGVCVPCGTGYTGFDGTCTDVDECAAGTPCGAGIAMCANLDGTYACTCTAGYGAPATGGTCARFTDLGDGTVRDNSNGLVWQQAIDANYYTQAGAIAYCAGLALDGGGWRLPTKDELLSIVDTRFSPMIDPTYFPGTPVMRFWSSSPVAGASALGSFVNFYDGYAGNDVATDTFRARCVR